MSSAFKTALLFPVSLIIVISGCAKQEYPPGGPEDRTAPRVLTASPQTGSVNIAPDALIRIEFTEPINRETVEKAVFVSPRTDPPPEVKAKRDAIEIVPKADWQANKTYIITVGTDLKDAHNVNLEQSIAIAFATGPAIDSGIISGTIYREGKAARGISVALFSRNPGEFEKPIDSIPPEYQTQTGEGGTFRFEYLPSDTFYAVAFDDRNKNLRVNAGREMFGVPSTIAVLSPGDDAREGLDMRLHSSDTSLISFRSATINSDGLLKLRFSKNLDSVEADTLFGMMTLQSKKDVGKSAEIADYTPLSAYPSSDFVFVIGGIVDGEEYELSIDLGSLYPALDDSLRMIGYTFTAKLTEDKTPPSVLDILPADNAKNISPDSFISIRVSEPLDPGDLDEAAWIIYGEGDTAQIEIRFETRFLYIGLPPDGLRYGNEYRWFLIEDLIRDRVGNAIGDSVQFFTFTTIGLDTLGSMSGKIEFASPGDMEYPVLVSFHPAQGGGEAELRVPAGSTDFRAALLPGYYTVSAFLDRDDDGEYDFGSLAPYRLAEPFIVRPDTIRVRTRFESSGVVIAF